MILAGARLRTGEVRAFTTCFSIGLSDKVLSSLTERTTPIVKLRPVAVCKGWCPAHGQPPSR